MKLPLFCFIALTLAAASMYGQQHLANETSVDSTIVIPPPSRLEKTAWLLGASVLFAGFDYVGYNLTRNHPTALKVYRALQVLTQSAISWLLYDQMGLPTAIGFNVIWWTFGTDFIYFGFAELVNPGHPWESRGDLGRGVMSNHCTWAYWTPIGIARGMRRNDPIAGNTLVAQALTGLALAFTITLTF
jgi:hypothetical protein